MVWPFKKKEEKSEEKEEQPYSDVPTEPYEPSYAKDEKRPSYSSVSYSPDAMPYKPSYDDVPTERHAPSYDEEEEEPRPKRRYGQGRGNPIRWEIWWARGELTLWLRVPLPRIMKGGPSQ